MVTPFGRHYLVKRPRFSRRISLLAVTRQTLTNQFRLPYRSPRISQHTMAQPAVTFSTPPAIDDRYTAKSTLCNDEVGSNGPKARTWLASLRQRSLFTPQHPTFSLMFLLSTVSVLALVTLHSLKKLTGTSVAPIWMAVRATSKASAYMLYINGAVVLFPVCHNLMFAARRKVLQHAFFSHILNAETQILLHRHIGWSMFTFAWIHGLAQSILLAQTVLSQNLGLGPFLYLNFATGKGLTGHITLMSLTLIALTSSEKLRNNIMWVCPTLHIPHTNHALFVLLWGSHHSFLLDSFGSSPWGWSLVCGTYVFLLEMTLRLAVRTQKLEVSKVILHPNKICELQFSKPNVEIKMGQVREGKIHAAVFSLKSAVGQGLLSGSVSLSVPFSLSDQRS